MKLDWTNFHVYADIANKEELHVENPQEVIANAILQNLHGIAAYDLAQKVYNDKGETEYNGKEASVIKQFADTLVTMWAVALNKIIVE